MRNADYFGFFCVTEQRTQEVAAIAAELGQEYSSEASDFGGGVKMITATLVLTDPRGLGEWHKPEPPKFYPGFRRLEDMGFVVEVEDVLEFSLRPEFDAVAKASSKPEVANAIAAGFIDAHSSLQDLCIPHFDMNAFLSEIGAFFTAAGQSVGEVSDSGLSKAT